MLLSSYKWTAIYRPLAFLQRQSLDLVHYCASEMIFQPNQIKKLFTYIVQIPSFSELCSFGRNGMAKNWELQFVTISIVGGRLKDGNTSFHNHILCFFCPLSLACLSTYYHSEKQIKKHLGFQFIKIKCVTSYKWKYNFQMENENIFPSYFAISVLQSHSWQS